jgi:hypothetical protein
MQVSKLADQTRKTMKSMNARLLKLNPLMFTIEVAQCRTERERERVYLRTTELLRMPNNK